MEPKNMKRTYWYTWIFLALSFPMFTGCLALSFGGKTEVAPPKDLDRLTRLETRIQNLEQYVGIQSPQADTQFADNSAQ